MKKKMTCLILASVLLMSLLSGCNMQMTMLPQNTKPVNSSKPTGSTEPAESTDPSSASPGMDLPEENFTFVNGVYASCENYDFTLYTGMSPEPNIEFYLVCEKPLPEDTQIVLKDVEATYKVSILNRSSNTSEEFLGNTNKVLYHYFSDPDFDFAGYQKEGEDYAKRYDFLRLELYGEDGHQPGETYPSNHEYAEEYEQLLKAKREYGQRYQAEYEAYKATEPRAPFYKYKVMISFRTVLKAEQIQSMELIAGDMSRTIPVKNVRIEPYSHGTLNRKGIASPVNIKDKDGARIYAGSECFSTTDSPALMCYIIANEDITLKTIYPYGDNTQIVPGQVELCIIGNDGKEIVVQWTPGKDLLIRKGEQVAMRILWSDPQKELWEYGMHMSIVVEYLCQGETCKTWGSVTAFHEIFDYYYYVLLYRKDVDLKRYVQEYANNKIHYG